MKEYEQRIVQGSTVRCARDVNGSLVVCFESEELVGAHVVAAFPLSSWGKMICVKDREGVEFGVINDMSELDHDSRKIMQEELEKSYFMPCITDIVYCEEKMNVVTLEVETDKGARIVQIRNVRKNIRNLTRSRVVIKDVDGNRYEISDWRCLPALARTYLSQYI